MIRVTVWNEYVQESGDLREEFMPGMPEEAKEHLRRYVADGVAKIREVYPEGVMGTLVKYLETCEDMQITSVNLCMPEYGLPDEVLDHTDVLVWWAHVAHDALPDSLVKKIRDRVLKGMGFIGLHSAHPSKPMQALLGTSLELNWREGDFARVWNVNPSHPIAKGIPPYFELEEEEMYGEYFDIPKPDDIVFLSWFRGGEVFRGGCTWHRGCGKIFYFHPGHETSPSYYNPYVRKIVENAIRWAAPDMWRESLDGQYVGNPPEEGRKNCE